MRQGAYKVITAPEKFDFPYPTLNHSPTSDLLCSEEKKTSSSINCKNL